MIRRWHVERQVKEFFKGDAVINLAFQFGIRRDIYPVKSEGNLTGAKPFLKEHAFKEHQRRICISAFIAFSDFIMFE